MAKLEQFCISYRPIKTSFKKLEIWVESLKHTHTGHLEVEYPMNTKFKGCSLRVLSIFSLEICVRKCSINPIHILN